MPEPGQAELSMLQCCLFKGLSESHFIDLLVTIASNDAEDPLFNQCNILALEVLYLLFRGVMPVTLASDQSKTCVRHTVSSFQYSSS